MHRLSRRAMLSSVLVTLGGCSSWSTLMSSDPAPSMVAGTKSYDDLIALPPPAHRLDVAVFRFLDQTGQHKPNQTFADYSFAVTQGGTNLLIKALRDAGSGAWFRVIERANVADLLQERQIIRANRIEFAGPDKGHLPDLAPLLNAGLILEGGIVGYDSNLVTGGVGANYLGIGASTQYSKDTVTVSLRAVSTLTGEVLTAIETTKTIYSVVFDGSVYKFVGFNKLLQVEAGFSTNEPVTICVTQAIELAAYSTIMEGALQHQWAFRDPMVQENLVQKYLETRGDQFVASDPRLSGQQ